MHLIHRRLNRAIGVVGLLCAVACAVPSEAEEVAGSAAPLFARAGEFSDPAAEAKGTEVSILAACGDGVQADGELCFLPETSMMAGLSHVTDVEVGYLNAGARLDFAATSYHQDRLRIGLGNGSGGLAGSFTYVTGDQPAAVALGDFNADSLRDIITADRGSDRARVRWNTGSNWNDWSTWNVGDGPDSIAAADLDGDGHGDFVTLNGGDDTTTVRLRNPAGGFFAGVSYAGATTYGKALALTDCDNDGDSDLIYGTGAEPSKVLARRNDGTGAFGGQLSAAFDTGFSWATVHAIATGDWNEDGDVDLMVVTGSDDVVRLLGDGDCTFSGIVSEEIPVPTLIGLVSDDLDGDGHEDVVVFNTSGEFGILLGTGNGNFAWPVEFNLGAIAYSVATGDMNEDGTPDLLFGGVNDVYFLESDP
jgi:hypothetical protein